MLFSTIADFIRSEQRATIDAHVHAGKCSVRSETVVGWGELETRHQASLRAVVGAREGVTISLALATIFRLVLVARYK